jgi:hypothetical protein
MAALFLQAYSDSPLAHGAREAPVAAEWRWLAESPAAGRADFPRLTLPRLDICHGHPLVLVGPLAVARFGQGPPSA